MEVLQELEHTATLAWRKAAADLIKPAARDHPDGWSAHPVLENRFQQLTHFRWVHCGANSALFQNSQFGLSGIITTGNQGASMAHALASWGGNPGNKANHWLLHIVFGPQSGIDLVRTTDFANHDHGIGIGVFVEHFQHINVFEAIDGVATNTNSR